MVWGGQNWCQNDKVLSLNHLELVKIPFKKNTQATTTMMINLYVCHICEKDLYASFTDSTNLLGELITALKTIRPKEMKTLLQEIASLSRLI